MDEFVVDELSGNLEDFLFGFFEDFGDVFCFLETESRNGLTSCDEATKGGFVFDDFGIFKNVSGGWSVICEFGEITFASHIFDFFGGFELGNEGEEVDGLAFFKKGESGGKNEAMSGIIKIISEKGVGDFDHGFAINQK